MSNMQSPADAQETPYPSEGYAWFVVGALFVVTLFSQLDRQLPALLVKPIRHAFGVSDTAFSLLQGYAFAIVYTLAGLPFGRLVDRANRRNLILIGLILWSVMTMLAGFAQSYWQLFATRMGVGIGEACLAPAAYSIIADYVPETRRGRALGLYYVSLAIGSGASLFLGGLIYRLTPTHGLVLPLVGLLPAWKLMFLVAGAPGLAIAFLVLAVREPVRRDAARLNLGRDEGSVGEFLAYLRRHAGAFSRVLSYPAILAIVGYGVLAWAPALFERRFSIPPKSSGLILGALVAAAGLVGTLISAFLSDRWAAKSVPAARLRVTLVAWGLIIPGVVAWPLVGEARLSFALLAVTVGALAIAQAAAPAAIQEIVPNRMRGQAVAVYLLIAGLMGIGFGPTAVALITDHVFHSDAALPKSLALIGAPMALIGLWLCWSGLKPYARTEAELAGGAPHIVADL
jgi:MFS family permease